MKRSIIVLAALVMVGVAFYPLSANAQMGPGYGPGYNEGPGYGPGYGMGPGMMGGGYGPGYGMGPGMMGGYGYGPGYGMGPGMMGGYGYGPGYGMGPGMMGGYGPGYGMGPGMMGPGYGYGGRQYYGPQYGQEYQQPQKPLDQDQAKQEVENYLSALRNPNLKVGKVEEKGNDYQVDVVTKDGSLVDKMLVDKNTGRMRSAY